METPKQANYALKTESVKNRTVCNDLNAKHTYAPPKIVKQLRNLRKFVYKSASKIINSISLSV